MIIFVGATPAFQAPAMILGQMIAVLLIDQAGIMGLTMREISPTRVAIGVILSYR